MTTEQPSIFTRIINREIPASIVYEDEHCIAILDRFPAMHGQSLIIPKQQVDYVFDLEDNLYQHIFTIAKKIAQASDIAFLTERTCLVLEGFEVPHAHIKLYPMTSQNLDLSSALANSAEAIDDNLEKAALALKAALTQI